MKIVMLERNTLGNDVDLSGFEELGEFIVYPFSTEKDTPKRIKDADVVLVNKVKLNENTLKEAKNLKLICLTATGTDNVDKAYASKRGIMVTNVSGYSTEAVAQHTFALLFYLLEKLRYYDNYVKSGRYCKSKMFSYFGNRFSELHGKTWGIVGLGAIGSRVADIARAFGCKVVYYSASGKNNNPTYQRVDFDTLLRTSDIISIHAPLTSKTQNLFNYLAFRKMKRTSILINVARGPIVNDKDLADALKKRQIAAAGLDVLSKEPMEETNPLRQIRDSQRLIITPHMAWGARETRQRLVDQVVENIRGFQNNCPVNVVNKDILIKNIILIGMPGVGKSTVGVILAKKLGFEFVDSDILIQAKTKRMLKDIIAQEGLEGFLDIEGQVNATVDINNVVLATGGSVIYRDYAMEHLKEIGTVVYLKVGYEQLEARLGNLKERGVALKEGQTLRDLYEERCPLYEKYADIIVDEEKSGLDETLNKVLYNLGKTSYN